MTAELKEEDENAAFLAQAKESGPTSSNTKAKMQNYPGNSNAAKAEEKPHVEAERPKVEPVTKAVKKKKTLGRKISETFTGDDMQSVGSYLLLDVMIPAAKNLVADMVTQGIERTLFGASRPRSGGISTGPKISYQNMYRGGPSNNTIRPSANAPISNRGRSTHDFSEIIIENRGDAEEIIERLLDLVERYGVATVKDFYDLVEVTSAYTDNKWGWNDLRTAAVERARGGGYVISLPPTREIE